jgi:hypothetical protein
MVFAGISYVAVIVAAVAGFIVGAAWYTVLAKPWMAAAGKTKDSRKPGPGPFLTSAVALLVMAYVLAGSIGHLGEVTLINGVISGAIVWAGFVATSMAVNYAFKGAPLSLSLIDGGHWLVVLVVMGAIIGGIGV